MNTKLPWHVGMKPGPMVYGPLGEQIADCRGLDESGYNANHIVRCVNAHDELVSTLKSWQDLFTRDGGYVSINVKTLLRETESALKAANEW